MTIFDEMESEVRYYCRQWPTMFVEAAGSTLTDADGRKFIDFFSGAGALSYGHNDTALQDAIVDHFNRGGLIHSLDMHTPEKAAFLEAVRDRVLANALSDPKLTAGWTSPVYHELVATAAFLLDIHDCHRDRN